MEITLDTVLTLFRSYGLVALVGGVIFGYIVSGLTGSGRIGKIAGLLAVLFLFLVPTMQSPKCDDCGASMQFGENYCSTCGYYQQTEDIFGKIKCEICESKIDADSVICGKCGAKIGSKPTE